MSNMKNERPDESLLNYINGRATDAEIKEVMQWSHEDPENMKELQTLRRLNDEVIWNADIADDHAGKKKRKSLAKRVLSWSVAASILLLALFPLSYLIFGSYRQNQMTRVSAPLGQRTELTLADGTRVWLNSGSRLEVPERFNGRTREVSLEGEAFFSVTKNDDMPFIVRTKAYNVKVMGTEFNVSSYTDAAEWSVVLVEGKVEIYDGKSTDVILTPNMKAEKIGGRLQTSEFSDRDALLWKEGILAFENASLADIFAKLGSYFKVSFEVEDSTILDRHSTCKFVTSDGIDCIIKVLLMGEGLTYDFDMDSRVIRIK